MPLRPMGSPLSLRFASPGGVGASSGLPNRSGGANPAAHMVNWNGSAIPVGYLVRGWSLPMSPGAMAVTADRLAASVGACAAKCFSRIAVVGLCSMAFTIHTLRLRWRRATGSAVAAGVNSTKCLSRMTCTGEIGARPSAQDIAYAVWGAPNAIAAGFSAGRIMRGVAAVNLGKKAGDTFRDVNDTADQVTGTTTPSGDRTAVTVGA